MCPHAAEMHRQSIMLRLCMIVPRLRPKGRDASGPGPGALDEAWCANNSFCGSLPRRTAIII